MSQRFRPSPKDQATRPGCVCLESYCGVHTNPVSRKLTPRFLSDMSVNSKGHCSLHVIYSEMTVLLKIFISLFVVGSEQRNIPGSLGHHRPNFSCRESVSRQILEWSRNIVPMASPKRSNIWVHTDFNSTSPCHQKNGNPLPMVLIKRTGS